MKYKIKRNFWAFFQLYKNIEKYNCVCVCVCICVCVNVFSVYHDTVGFMTSPFKPIISV